MFDSYLAMATWPLGDSNKQFLLFSDILQAKQAAALLERKMYSMLWWTYPDAVYRYR